MVNVELINELWLQIDKLHLSYLQTEGFSPERIDQKHRLQGYMKEYLCLVTANQRFYSATTKHVLYSSILAAGEKHFSPSKIGAAWELLGMYAANLLGQPWRREFREIRLYSGAFKYQIEKHLKGAEEVLMEMGYTLDVELNRLIIQGLPDYDRMVLCHRDCLLAQVESQILGEIHAALSVSLRPCSWMTVFEYRDSYVGSVAHCVRGLMFQQSQKEQQNIGYAYHTMPMSPFNLGPHEIYPTNFTYQQPIHSPYHHQHPLIPMYGYSYTTGHSQPKAANSKALPPLPVEEPLGYPTPMSKNSDKASALEKPVQELFEAWNRDAAMKSVPKFDALIDIDRLEQLCYDEVDSHQDASGKLDDTRTSNGPEKVVSAKLQSETKRDKHSIDPSPVPRTSAVKQRPTLPSSGDRSKEKECSAHSASDGTTVKIPPRGWECAFCTYVNKEDREICDMCSKSKNRGPESRPLYRGGRECSNCTLVNPPEAEQCGACSTSLTHAPTYI